MQYFILLLFLASFSTVFSQTDVFLEDFQTWTASDYTLANQDGLTPHANVSEYTEAWIITEDPDDSANLVASSTSYFDPPGRADRWLISPAIDLGAFGNFVSWQAKSFDASFPDSYDVLVSTTGTNPSDFTDTIGIVQNEYQYWQYRQANLSEAGLDNQQIYLAFVLRTYDGHKLFLDSIRVWKEDPVAVEELASEKVKLFPNPAKESFQIQTESAIQQVTIQDVQGKELVRIEQVSNGNINIASFPTGVYMVSVRFGNGILVREKLVKI